MNTVIELIHRNLITTFDKTFIILQIFWPAIFIFVAGLSFSGLLGDKKIEVGNSSIPYPAFLTAGMIGFNIMNSSTTSGSIIWSDKRNGMFHQFLVMPISRLQYIVSNLLTIVIMGLASASLVIVVGSPLLLPSIQISLVGVIYTIYGLLAGSILFGSLTIILSVILRTNEQFGVIVNALFPIFAFLSSTFYPPQSAPAPLEVAFYLNPLTHIITMIRDGLFSQITSNTNIEAIILGVSSTIVFTVAIISLNKSITTA